VEFSAKAKVDALEDVQALRGRFERHEAELDAGLVKMVAKLKLFESK